MTVIPLSCGACRRARRMAWTAVVFRVTKEPGDNADSGAHPRISDLVNLGWGLRICISSKFPGAAEAAGPGTTL